MSNVWTDHIATLRDSNDGRLLGVTMALAAEVMLLKAEVHRLRDALHADVLDPRAEEAAGETSAFQDWLRAEQAEFARTLLQPWLEPDAAPDVSAVAADR
jgi:hypothetical protein